MTGFTRQESEAKANMNGHLPELERAEVKQFSLSISRWKERKQGTLVTKQDRKASEAVNIRTSHHIHMIHRTGLCYMISFMLIYDLAHQQLEYILHLYKTDTHSKHQLGHCLSLCH